MKKIILLVASLLLYSGTTPACYGEQNLHTKYVTEAPVIDGLADDPAWENAQEITTLDKSGTVSITIKSVYTDADIFIQVRFPDSDESRTHKSWTWDKGRELYMVGNDREDIVILKWNMADNPVDLSIFSESSHQADIWFWKACRTDAAGYADDKSHIFSHIKKKDATKITSKSGKPMYLLRKGDDGTSAYRINLTTEYQGEILPRYIPQQPTGSRSDVQAKGTWENGAWTIEFRRGLVTEHQDDVQFTPGKKFLFGISRYEIAGRDANQKLSQPLYGTGDVNESLWLEFIK